jgi:putative thioredoxin
LAKEDSVSGEPSAWVQNVAEADFEREVIAPSRDKPVVVDFWAPWCGPCRQLGPILERLVNERQGEVTLAKVNVDEAQRLAYEFGINAIPVVMAFRDGRPALSFQGLLPEAQLRAFLDKLSPSEADRLVQQAKSLEADKPAEAEALYRKALAADREHEPSLLGLARVLIGRHQVDEAADLLEQVAPGAELDRLRGLIALRRLASEGTDEAALRRRLQAEANNAALHYQLGVLLAGAGKHKEALEELLTAGRADKKLAGSKVKEAMVQIFHIVGARSELADNYRDQLTKLLY